MMKKIVAAAEKKEAAKPAAAKGTKTRDVIKKMLSCKDDKTTL